MSAVLLEDSTTTERATIRAAVRADAQMSRNAVMLNALSAVMATYGLFADSPAVVIGAMVVATPLGPILGVAMGVADRAPWHLARALRSLALVIATIAVTSLLLGWFHRGFGLTDQILDRTAPSMPDLLIALAGGAAGTLVAVSPRLGSALVGVAIATALVPPLAAGSVLLARGEGQLAAGAILLATTNMIAITFAASLIFWLAGFRRQPFSHWRDLRDFAQRNALAACLVLVLGIGFGINFGRSVEQQAFESAAAARLEDGMSRLPGDDLVETRFVRDGDRMIVLAVVRGDIEPTAAIVAEIEQTLPTAPRAMTELRIRFVPTITLGRGGPVTGDTGPASRADASGRAR